ncbi:hypothetical protein [Lacticaseibacillus suihuaensis]
MLDAIFATLLWIGAHRLTVAALIITFILGATWGYIENDTEKAAKRANA